MKLYENIVIGNFLFALGYAIRDKKRIDTLRCSINLLQQTPADPLLGDLLAQFPGTVRLIEFKAQGARIDKEVGRHSTLSKAVGAAGFEEISRDIHWYIESAADEDVFRTRLVPYLDAFYCPGEPKRQFLETFIDKLACEVAEGSVRHRPEDIRKYLDWVRLTLGSKGKKGSGAIGSGALLLVVEPNGALSFIPMHDLMELNLHRNELLPYRNKLDQVYAQELEREFSRERSYGQRGMSL